MDLTGRTAIITGAAGGIGAAAARLFVRKGAQVMLVDREEASLSDVAAPLGEHAAWFVADVSDEEQARAYVAACAERFGGVDILFANAGIEGRVAPLVLQEREDFVRVFEVNVLGVWFGIKHVVPMMARRGGGSIVVTSSVAGIIGSEGLGPYVASKHALMGLVKTAAQELAVEGIRVNAVNPGPIANRMMASIESQANPDAPERVHTAFEQLIPLGRYGSSEEVAEVALFLASGASSYCTGGAFLVDGGFVSM
ncbi:MAG: SDR family oxidoreductase [Deltaproteobacteria bacterium]|nr:SDR family oxidoreductase [Deltaproteobacteria bacterium]